MMCDFLSPVESVEWLAGHFGSLAEAINDVWSQSFT